MSHFSNQVGIIITIHNLEFITQEATLKTKNVEPACAV